MDHGNRQRQRQHGRGRDIRSGLELIVVRGARQIESFADDVERTPLHLLVNASDVFAQYADHEELDAREERNEGHRGAPARYRRVKHEMFDHCPDGDDDARHADEDAEVRSEAERKNAERRDGVERKTNHLADRVFRFSGRTTGPMVGHSGLPKADPGHDSAYESVCLAQRS
jgi:hypothetical protein